ncbi:MAG: serine acetyltransferase [Planctomycetaceae bacterium]|jgi:serine O-acetyltransferase|nr:serine acetyltransferase [Planctomycetaceae bacterium]
MATDLRLKESLPELTERIIVTYSELKGIQHLDLCPLPSYDAVTETIQDLKEILFPGYRRLTRLHRSNVTYHVGELIDKLHSQLSVQIERAFCHSAEESEICSPQQKFNFEILGQQKSYAFLEQLPAIREMLALDVEAAFAGDPACRTYDEVIFCYPGLEAVTIYRLANALHRLEVPFIPRMMTEYAHARTGIDIHPGATIGKYFFIDHGTGVVIGETCEIGEWVKLYQGVTLGALSFAKDGDGNLVRGTKRHPTIEDNVVIYANATVLGGNTVIGKGSVVGSNVWLTSSILPGTTVSLERPSLRIRNDSFIQDFSI